MPESLEQALTLYKLHLADQPPQLDYYRAVIDIETYRKRLDSVYLYIDRALEVFPEIPSLYARKGHAQGMPESCRNRSAAIRKPSNTPIRTPARSRVGIYRRRLSSGGRGRTEGFGTGQIPPPVFRGLRPFAALLLR